MRYPGTRRERLYARIEAQSWFRGDRAYRPAGFDRRKDLVHFTVTWSWKAAE